MESPQSGAIPCVPRRITIASDARPFTLAGAAAIGDLAPMMNLAAPCPAISAGPGLPPSGAPNPQTEDGRPSYRAGTALR
jgi:hypothetical protein